MDLAQRIGVEKYYDYLRRFGIGVKTGVDFYGESAGLVLPKQYIRPVDLARIGFGQAIATSPVQLVSAFAAVVGDGILRTPHFVQQIPQAGVTVTGRERGRVISAETSATMRQLLLGVVNEGSGKRAAQAGFAIGGKTGTAQKYEGGIIAQGKYISSFISFIEYQGVPRYVVFLYVDQPSRQGYYGSIVAAPYVGEIFAGIIEYLNMQPDQALVPPNAPAPITISSVAQMPLHMAVATLQRQGFFVQVSGEGLTALGTFPATGEVMQRGSPVVVRT